MTDVAPETSSPRYRCTRCGAEQTRGSLTVKKALFQGLGNRGQWQRSRTIAWLCDPCKMLDVDWNRKPTKGVPTPTKSTGGIDG
jgi:hypothetical protein